MKTKPLAILLLSLICCGCKVYHMGLRNRQLIKPVDTETVSRVYFDRYGDLYPDVTVPIDTNRFRVYGKRSAKKVASLVDYFLRHPEAMKRLRNFYGVSPDSTNEAAYREAQRRIRRQTVKQISEMVSSQKAGRLVYLVHGLNDTRVDTEYKAMRQVIQARHYSADRKPIYVEVHWDSMNARDTDGMKVIKIWVPALLNSRFVSLRFRNLMAEVEEKVKVPEIMITHSLGAGIAFGALFNTNTKWKGFNVVWPKIDKKYLNTLSLSPTPKGIIRIGVIAPAVPAESTFIDFNQREPEPVTAANNNIQKVVIGYNYQDYAVSKQALHVNLAGVYGSTSLGCNCSLLGEKVIPGVLKDMEQSGYTDPTSVIVPIEFQTPKRTNPPKMELGGHEHAWKYYMVQPQIPEFLDILFGTR